MRATLTALIACAFIPCSLGASYTVQMYSRSSVSTDGLKYGYTVTTGGSNVFSGDSTLSGSTYSMHSGAYQWYQTAVSVAATDLPSAFQSFATTTYSSFAQLGPLLYRMKVTADQPDVVYFGGASGNEFKCSATTVAFHSAFTCSDQSTAAQIASLSAPTEGSLWTLTADISDNTDTIISLMAMLATNLQTEKETLISIEQASADRRSNGQSVSIGFYFIGTLAFFALVAQSVACLMWLWQPLGKAEAMANPNDLGAQTRMVLHNAGLWWFSTCLVVAILMGVWQFPALIIFAMILFAFVLVVSILYAVLACIRYRKRSVVVPEDASPAQVKAEPIVERPLDLKKDEGAKLLAEAATEPGSATGSGSGVVASSELVADTVPPGSMGLPPKDATAAVASEWQSQTCPHEMKNGTIRACYAISAGLVLLLLIIEAAMFFGWTEKKYYVLDRANNVQEHEFQPSSVAKALLLMYSFDSLATDLNYNVFCDISTTYCEKYIDDLGSDRSTIKTNWIDKYSIDMSQFSPTDYAQYVSVNEWFVRGLASGARPISTTSGSFVAAADGRAMVFTNIWSTTRFWVKSSRVDTADILDSSVLASDFNGASMAIYRLAPQDYHRFHTPVAGTITHISYVLGSLFSVSADAAVSKNAAFLNQRHVLIINSPEFGTVAYVAVGATCVGSTVITRSVGDTITKGEELGFMQFGGSTVVLLFQAGKVEFDADLIYNSAKKVETHVLMGEHNGLAI